MGLLRDEPDHADPRRVALEAERTADRLRSLSLVRLRVPLPEGDTRAGRAFELAQQLADVAADLAQWPRRRLPELPDSSAGDALAVCAADFIEQVCASPERDQVAQLSVWATEALIGLRQVL